jgi:hypothetical protein
MLQSSTDFAGTDQSLGFAQTLLLRTCTDSNGLEGAVNAVESVARFGSIGRNRQPACTADKDCRSHGDRGRSTT